MYVDRLNKYERSLDTQDRGFHAIRTGYKSTKVRRTSVYLRQCVIHNLKGDSKTIPRTTTPETTTC